MNRMSKDKEKDKEDYREILKKIGEGIEKLEEEESKKYKRIKQNGNDRNNKT